MPFRAASSLRIAAMTLVAVTVAACTNQQAAVNKNPHNGHGTATLVDGIQQVTITTGNDYRFHPSTITVHQGKVRIILENKPGDSNGPPHDLSVTGLPGAYVPLAAAGQIKQVTFTAPAPGSYRFVCTIHVNQGQTGTLIVKAGPPT